MKKHRRMERKDEIEYAAFNKMQEDLALQKKYQTPISLWMDWFRFGAEWADEHPIINHKINKTI